MGNRRSKQEEEACKDDSIQLFIWNVDHMFVDTIFFTQDINVSSQDTHWRGGRVRKKRLPKLEVPSEIIPLVCSFDFLRKLIDQGIYNRLDIDLHIIEPTEFAEFEEVVRAHSPMFKLKIRTLRIRVRVTHPPQPYFTDTIEHENFSWLRWNGDVGHEEDPGVQITEAMLGKNELCLERKILNPEILREFRGSRLTLWECQEYGLNIDFITDIVERYFAGDDSLKLNGLYLMGLPITDEQLHKLVHGAEMEKWEQPSNFHKDYKCSRCFLTNSRDVQASIILPEFITRSIIFVVDPLEKDWEFIMEYAHEYESLLSCCPNKSTL